MSETNETPASKPKLMPNKEQGFAIAGIVSAMIALQPVKDWFFTREEGLGLGRRVEVVETSTKVLQDALISLERRQESRIAESDRKNEERMLTLRSELKTEIKESSTLILNRMSEMIDRTISSQRANNEALVSQLKDLRDEQKSLRERKR